MFDSDLTPASAGRAARIYAVGALAIGLAFVSAVLALAIHMAIAAAFLIGPGPFPNAVQRRPRQAPAD